MGQEYQFDSAQRNPTPTDSKSNASHAKVKTEYLFMYILFGRKKFSKKLYLISH
jgi:hypothetical protein